MWKVLRIGILGSLLGVFGVAMLQAADSDKLKWSDYAALRKQLFPSAYKLYTENPQGYASTVTTSRVALGVASNLFWRRILSEQLGNKEALGHGRKRRALNLKDWLRVKNAGVCPRLTSNFFENLIVTAMYSFVPGEASPIVRAILLGFVGGATTPFSYLTMAKTQSADELLLRKRENLRSYWDIIEVDHRYLLRGAAPKVVGDVLGWVAFLKLSQMYQCSNDKRQFFDWRVFLGYTTLCVAAEGAFTFPLTSVRVDMQKNAPLNRTFWQTANAIHQEHGWRGFVRGGKIFFPVSFFWNGLDLWYLNVMAAFHAEDLKRSVVR